MASMSTEIHLGVVIALCLYLASFNLHTLKKRTTGKNAANSLCFHNMFRLVIGHHELGVQYSQKRISNFVKKMPLPDMIFPFMSTVHIPDGHQ